MVASVSSPPVTIERYFNIMRLNSPDLLAAYYRLRYQVYCQELRFIRPDQCQGDMETDAFDGRSVAAGLVSVQSGVLAAALRLVLPDGCGRGTLPFRRRCFDESLWDTRFLPGSTTAEISRFVVAASYRRRAGEVRYADMAALGGGSTVRERRAIPHITLGLLRCLIGLGEEHRISHVIGLFEAQYRDALVTLGVNFQPLGPPVVFHGIRVPYWIELAQITVGIRRRPELANVLAASMLS